jgi:hypothetical protein
VVRLVLALVLVASIGVAGAETKRKVRIETTPPGATVYLVEKEAGPACEPTPCSVNAPVGETPIIVELKGYTAVFDNLSVPRRGRVRTAKFTLDPAVGKIVVKEPEGATVFVDEEDQGKVPLELEVSADAHHVVVKQDGDAVYDGYVEVQAGNETLIEDEASGDESDDADEDDDEDDDQPDGDADVTEHAPPPPARVQLLRGTVSLDIGFRKFAYNAGSNQRPETEGGQVMITPMIEVWPGRLAKVAALRGLSLMGRFAKGINQQPVTSNDLGPQTATFWQGLEISAREQLVFGKLGVELGAGYVRDQVQFVATPQDDLKLPDAVYSSVRVGARISAVLGKVEPYVAFEPRFVLSGGKLENRYDAGTKASGLHGRAGVLLTFGHVVARVEGSLTRYAWTFVNSDPEIMDTSSGTDRIMQIGVGAGYQY